MREPQMSLNIHIAVWTTISCRLQVTATLKSMEEPQNVPLAGRRTVR